MTTKPVRTAGVLPLEQLADPAVVTAAYSGHLERTGLAPLTITSYVRKVTDFGAWLAASEHHDPVDTFTDGYSRDFATRDYRAHLLARGLAPKTVDAHLSALDNLWEWAGLGRAKVSRVRGYESGAGYGEHLTRDQARDVLRAATRRGNARDLALVGLMLFAGLRVAEVHGVNEDDVWTSARAGRVEVRHGKGSKVRQVDLSAQLRPILNDWRTARRTWPGADSEPALFLSTRGTRLAVRSINHTVGEIGRAVGIDLHPHLLRHTCARNLLDAGATIVDVQRVLGHSSVRTTQGYTQPSAEQAAAAMDRVAIDY